MVPILRFPEFNDDWCEKSLKELLQFKNGINANKEQYGHGRKFINVLDILNNNYIKYGLINDSVNVDQTQELTYKVEYGDILFLRSSETREDVGKCNVYLDDKDFALFGGFVIRGKKTGEYDPFFLKLLLNSSKARNQISSKSGGSTRFNVSQDILESVQINMPCLEEQQKISCFFTMIDNKINQQIQKIKQLQLFKKSMLQKIFSQEIRFKNENREDFPEWEEVSLGEVAHIIGGGTPSTSEKDYWNGDIPWFTPTEISGSKYISVSKRTITEKGLKNSSAKLLPKGTVLLTTRATLGEMAISKAPVTTNQGFQSLVPCDSIDGEFLYYLQPLIKKYCIKNASGSTFLEISKSNLEQFTFLAPSKQEQQKIVTFLSALDKKIDAEKEKKQFWELLKNSLMQQMFV